jgi:hypothetical protein
VIAVGLQSLEGSSNGADTGSALVGQEFPPRG